MNAFVVAGGQSARMGRDKALLSLEGTPLLQLALDALRSLGLSPRICGSRPDRARFAEVIPDNFAPCGPLAGIEAALAVSDTDLNLFLAVDLPLLPAAFLCWLMERAGASEALATIPVFGDRPQPLCAVYSRRLLQDSEGAGRHRGAPSIEVEFGPTSGDVSVGYVSDGAINPAQGVRGGLPGGRADQWRITVTGTKERLPACAQVVLHPGERIVSVSTGGGGYGSPCSRDPLLVSNDVKEGWISSERARSVYGVALNEDGSVDEISTLAIRKEPR